MDFLKDIAKTAGNEYASLVADGQSDEEAKLNAPLLLEAQEMLRKWAYYLL